LTFAAAVCSMFPNGRRPCPERSKINRPDSLACAPPRRIVTLPGH
jgi:hypothetical protein